MCGWYYDIAEEMEEEERTMNIENTIKVLEAEIKQYRVDKDPDVIQLDFDNELLELLNEEFEKSKKPGESFDEWEQRQGPGIFKQLISDARNIQLAYLDNKDDLIRELKQTYPKEYFRILDRDINKYSIEDLKQILQGLDNESVPFFIGGLVSKYKSKYRKP